MLKALRFYGNYTTSTDFQNRQIDVAALNDPIAQLIQDLFPSPDGTSFLPNTLMREPGGFLSRHLESVNDIIKVLISDEADKKSQILDILRPKKEGKFLYGRGIDRITATNAEQFTDNLLAAHNYTLQGQGIPYPQHTAITVLNAFFISVAEKVEELENLTFLMKAGFTTRRDLKPFTQRDFDSYYPQINQIMTQSDLQPELISMMAYGQNKYNNPALSKEVLAYKTGVEITLASGEKATFSDCGETSLRNFFWKLSHLSPLALQEFFKNIETANPDVGSAVPYQKLKESAYDKNFLGSTASEAYNKWAQIISGLNSPTSAFTFDSVAYTQSDFYEIEAGSNPEKKALGGIFNWLNVIAKLIPDPILSESWGDLKIPIKWEEKLLISKLHKKLNRLCELSSSQLSYKLSGELPYPTLEFYYLVQPYFEFEFLPYHYQSRLSVPPTSIDWKKSFYTLPIENPWLGAFFNRTNGQSESGIGLSGFVREGMKRV